MGQFNFPDFGAISNPQVWITGFTIALVASLETLLCVEATDKLDPEKRVTPTNRELDLAQGTGNMISGFIGGLPITQVIVRSSANIQSGGKTKASGNYSWLFPFDFGHTHSSLIKYDTAFGFGRHSFYRWLQIGKALPIQNNVELGLEAVCSFYRNHIGYCLY